MTENSPQSEEPNSHHHWVETLFPPRFTFQDLLSGKDDSSKEHGVMSTRFRPLALPSERAESRRQIYLSTLKKIQQSEEKIRRNKLEERISRTDQPTDRLNPQYEVQSKDSPGKFSLACSGLDSDGKRNIWNEKDISMFRTTLAAIERDRWRLRQQLRSAEEQLKVEQEKRRQLGELLEEREGQLDHSRKEAARRALEVRTLRAEAQKMELQLQRLAKERQAQVKEADRLRAELRKAKSSCEKIRLATHGLGL